MREFTSLVIPHADDLLFGESPRPVSCGFGLNVGGGLVFPELNFTLPTMSIEDSTWSEVEAHYEEIAAGIVKSAKRLRLPGLMVEFELLPPMTEHPEWGAAITAILKRSLTTLHEQLNLPCALRVTPTDLRDRPRPPILRTGIEVDLLWKSFEACAQAGADVLSIESVGGKEVHDQALLYGDIRGAIFALGVLAPRDMAWLWDGIVGICGRTGSVPGADSACGFANTAMQLASQGMLPEVLAAVIRAASAVRSLVAYERGAVGPSKDCAYEGPVLKAITGTPISMEGKSASCAHFSPVGNVAAAMCDLWSNESVQNVRLLSGSAPEAFLELLAYDCRLFNTARDQNLRREYRSLLVNSDISLSPQALVLSPDSTIRIAEAIVRYSTPYQRTLGAARTAVKLLRESISAGSLSISDREAIWLDKIDSALAGMPERGEELLDEMLEAYGSVLLPESYGFESNR